MYDPADITEPPTCEDCDGYVNDHDAACRTGQGITSDLENTLDAEAADWALASRIVDFELGENAAYWVARREARA
ncbi:hypothetical protein KNT58_gp93 [Mycobacterium phage Fortunato]|uniref:Phage zinc binding domain-containing protein n=1 Tax=Mycobacterium phage Fortunato TaxID=1882439 RepID=A0A1D8EYL4_9CAUD|nr:hypothetical protein KNT58_gp93 [Mycobacterium phage Fortunato]AOT27313.1 hypothetical protein SEA_FORTUNATO_93 [Mycobacterium phage Fortunato]